jgi:hypothetical protein
MMKNWLAGREGCLAIRMRQDEILMKMKNFYQDWTIGEMNPTSWFKGRLSPMVR